MITTSEILGHHRLGEIPADHQRNIAELVRKMCAIRVIWGKPMLITSGYRSMQDHIRIYHHMNFRRLEKGLSKLKVPMASKHLYGQACDVYDPEGKLFEWCKAHEYILQQVGLWCEEKDDEPRVHFQIVPPLSGKRFFAP